MGTTKECKNFILEQLNLLDDITCRPMMGEYLLDYKKTLFLLITDILFFFMYFFILSISLLDNIKTFAQHFPH